MSQPAPPAPSIDPGKGRTLTRPRAYLDCETTGLDPRIHQPWEVAYLYHDPGESLPTLGLTIKRLEHTLDHASPDALRINRYWERNGHESAGRDVASPARMAQSLLGRTLVGANIRFDAAMLARYIGYEPWHYRLIDVEAVAMPVLGLVEPVGLADLRLMLNDRGADIPAPDHTAAADVMCVVAVHDALERLSAVQHAAVAG